MGRNKKGAPANSSRKEFFKHATRHPPDPNVQQTTGIWRSILCGGRPDDVLRPPTTLASTPTAPPPKAAPSQPTTGATYTTLKHWAPVVARSTNEPCSVDVVQPAHYANATHHQNQWKAATADAKDRESYEAYNSTDSNVHPSSGAGVRVSSPKGVRSSAFVRTVPPLAGASRPALATGGNSRDGAGRNAGRVRRHVHGRQAVRCLHARAGAASFRTALLWTRTPDTCSAKRPLE